MPEEQFKRNVAYKLRIGDILMGKPLMNEERFSFLELGDKKIIRVNLIGNLVDKYESEGESKYLSLTLDDGSGQIKLKSFSDDSDKFREFFQGQTVVVVGVLRIYNNELYISPEIIRVMDSKYLVIRKMEIEKERAKNLLPLQKNQIVAVKDKILDMIKNAEGDGGIEIDLIIMNLRDAPSDIINQEIKKLLEEGIVFEPRPGKVRWLG